MQIDAYTVGTQEYHEEFWNKAMRGKGFNYDKLKGGSMKGGMFVLPYDSNRAYADALSEEGFFRTNATCVKLNKEGATIYTEDSDDVAKWVPEGGSIDVTDALDTLNKITVQENKLAVITKYQNDLVSDIGFDMKKHLIKRLAQSFGRAEENAFLNGTGVGEPVGILHNTDGADVGVTSETVTFDDVLKLFLSVKSKYRKNAIWVMNDETALVLRTLKDKDGNYLWNHNTDTIFGRTVCISEYMPSAEGGSKCIVFGDFSYYWIIDRKPLSVRILKERFALHDQTGYLASEYIDAKLIRSEAIKVMQIS